MFLSSDFAVFIVGFHRVFFIVGFYRRFFLTEDRVFFLFNILLSFYLYVFERVQMRDKGGKKIDSARLASGEHGKLRTRVVLCVGSSVQLGATGSVKDEAGV